MAKIQKISELRDIDVRSLSDKALRQAYSAYREALRKRIERLSEGTAAQRAYAAPYQKGGYKELLTLTQIKNLPRKGWSKRSLRSELEMRVAEMQAFERKDRSSLAGWARIESRTIKALQSRGYKGITKENIEQFGEYMEMMREKFGTKIFPSEYVAELYSEAEIGDLSADEFITAIQRMGGFSGVDLFA